MSESEVIMSGWAQRMVLTPVVALLLALSPVAALAQSAGNEVHGTSDAYAGNGVLIVWGVLRGATDDAAQVVLRVAADPAKYDRVAAEGVDPFTGARQPVAADRPIGAYTDLRMPRTRFADFPRTDLRFTGAAAPLVVYYLGVPDTSPEFANAAALEAHLAARIAALRGGNGKESK
jgi:hypothetical protein